MMNALASDFSDRGDVVYRFVAYGFTMGKQVCEALQLPCVKRIFAINRAVQNEAHYFNEFFAFSGSSPRTFLVAWCDRTAPPCNTEFDAAFWGTFYQ